MVEHIGPDIIVFCLVPEEVDDDEVEDDEDEDEDDDDEEGDDERGDGENTGVYGNIA